MGLGSAFVQIYCAWPASGLFDTPVAMSPFSHRAYAPGCRSPPISGNHEFNRPFLFSFKGVRWSLFKTAKERGSKHLLKFT